MSTDAHGNPAGPGSGSPACPTSLKRRHRPNTMYANDFVFSSVRKSKVQKVDPELGSRQALSATGDRKKVLFGRKNNIDSSSKKTDEAVDIVKKKSKSESDLRLSRSCDVAKQGRSKKRHDDSSVTENENDKSNNLSTSLSLSPDITPLKSGEKAIIRRDQKPCLANTSLPEEHLKRANFTDSLTDKTIVPLSLPSKRGQRQKKSAGKISPKSNKKDANCSHESSEVNTNLLDERLKSEPELYSGQRRRRRPPKKLYDDDATEASQKDSQKDKATVNRRKCLSTANVSLSGDNFRTGFDCSSDGTKSTLHVSRKRGQPPKKSGSENRRKTFEFAAEHCLKDSSTENGNTVRGNRPSRQNFSRRVVRHHFGEAASRRDKILSHLTKTSFSGEELKIDSDSSHAVPLTARRRRMPKKFADGNVRKVCEFVRL